MALVIIDMQYEFNPNSREVESNVLRLIEWAKSGREAIFVVSFLGCGRTLASVLRAVKDYPLTFHVRKNDQDGSEQLVRAIEKAWKRARIQRFSKMRFCGVYTSMCVADTFISMCQAALAGSQRTALHPSTEMELVASACSDPDNQSNALQWIKRQRKQFPKLRVA